MYENDYLEDENPMNDYKREWHTSSQCNGLCSKHQERARRMREAQESESETGSGIPFQTGFNIFLAILVIILLLSQCGR